MATRTINFYKDGNLWILDNTITPSGIYRMKNNGDDHVSIIDLEGKIIFSGYTTDILDSLGNGYADYNTFISAVSDFFVKASLINVLQTTGSSEADTMSQKAITEKIAEKQDTLVSGQNIKTVNGNDITGPGDVVIASTGAAVVQNTGTSETAVMSQKAVSMRLEEKESANKNILLSTSYTLGKVVKKNYVISTLTNWRYSDFIAVKPNTVYTKKSFNYAIEAVFYDINKNEVSDAPELSSVGIAVGVDYDFITPPNCHYIRFNFNNSYWPDPYLYEKNMFDKSILLKSYAQKVDIYPSDILGSVNGYGNLLIGSTFKIGSYLTNNGAEATLSSMSYTENYIRVDPLKKYMISYVPVNYIGAYYDADYNYISMISSSAGSHHFEFTSPYNAKYIRINKLTSDQYLFICEKENYDKVYIPQYSFSSKTTKSPVVKISDINENSFIGSYNFVIKTLLTQLPTARIILISHFTCDDWQISRRYESLIKSQIDIANYWNIPICDLSSKSGWINRSGIQNITQFCADGIHPNTESYPHLSDIIVGFLKTFISDTAGKKFAWYGTSIPARINSYADLSVNTLGGVLQKYAVSSSSIRRKKYDGTLISNSFLNLESETNYQNKMIDLIGSDNEPDFWIFDFGVNDIVSDRTDFDLYDFNNKL